MELNESSVVGSLSADQSNANEMLSQATAASGSNIMKFFEGLDNKNNQTKKNISEQELPQDDSSDRNPKLNIHHFDEDYKLNPNKTTKAYNYSINEMLSIKELIPKEFIEGYAIQLPKKKFWRLSGRFADGNGNNKNASHRSNNNRSSGISSNNRPASGEGGQYGRRNSKSKIRGPNVGKKSNRYGKNDKYVEENDIKVNNSDLMELEGDFQPTGNSMADFEAWKAKMKEMENKKKGIVIDTPKSAEASSNAKSGAKSSTSILDFLEFESTDSSENNENATNEIPVQPTSNKDSGSGSGSSDSQEAATVGTSRFSSFFVASPSSTPLTDKNSASSPAQKQQSDPATSTSGTNIAGGSRMMSFFKNESKQSAGDKKTHKETVNTPRDANIPIPSNTPPQFSQQRNGPNDAQPQMLHPQVHGQPPLNNNAFFQGLLNKGKAGEEGNMLPPGMPLPAGGPGHLQQPPPPGMGQGFPMGMPPPPHMMPPPGFPPFQGQGLPMQNNPEHKRNINNGSPNPANNSNQRMPPRDQLKIQNTQQRRMMPPGFPQGAVPPGFPPMQGFPQNFDPNNRLSPKGMMQMNGQNFYPMMPPMPNRDQAGGF
ncbi:hypothetical protein Kpol_1018p178 [Vanderwaltozyma polyspora DSM 70294]|uniref:Uncharacterized protein n=1 Tax=Vanderwaltozyma polyspora (strain ATCC 22028 / DSM 70294 / BCRC 21397 / CBS 2163 / NBRC 10782 / NRRL Y-8283 / UCD 57-17) TaxID=436907 RepID=A7TE18_VANPO|nr:uncharacterized protein Kpol_1018p178 [Vanderwaltozyma polyspora DSM 70294]EDO19638.1 hypothetical protein Kpol_1018p178 [Vanderwaltozyma polyspora DSM 70294]